MRSEIHGIHHVTAICGEPQKNVDFYAGLLGLKLVKKTVNFDDPTTYHLYYGDEAGRPGSILTFFAWPGAPAGRTGVGQVTSVSFRAPPASLPYWAERLAEHGVSAPEVEERNGEQILPFEDPDGLAVELVGRTVPAGDADVRPGGPEVDVRPGGPETDLRPSGPEARAGPGGPVPAEHGLRGFAGVALTEADPEPTAGLLTELMGFRLAGEGGGRARFEAAGTEPETPGRNVDVLARPDVGRGRVAVGSVHHVAFRTPTEESQREARGRLFEAGYAPTPIIDRFYFRSIYFREPGGVLFEVATDPPGFGLDEESDAPASGLRLPPWLEERRAEIEGVLPPLGPPRPERSAS